MVAIEKDTYISQDVMKPNQLLIGEYEGLGSAEFSPKVTLVETQKTAVFNPFTKTDPNAVNSVLSGDEAALAAVRAELLSNYIE